MRIALDATYSVDRYPSGIAVYSRELMRGLAQAFASDEFVWCYRLKQFRQSKGAGLANAQRRLLLPPLPTFRADLFHALNQRVDRRPAKRVMATFHDLFVMTGEYSTPEFRQRFAAQARQAAEQADVIVAVSEFTARQVHQLLGVEHARIRIVPHGVRRARSAGEESRKREKMILSVGTLQIRKNLVRLVEAFQAVSHDWKLVLAGAPGGHRAAEIVEAIERSSARDRIVVTGYLAGELLEELYDRASVFAFPSLAEGFGMPVLEAMVHGVAVLTSQGSACQEVAGDAALLVDPQQTAEIAAGLVRLTQEPEVREKLAQKGREHAGRYNWERAVSSTYQIYRELVD